MPLVFPLCCLIMHIISTLPNCDCSLAGTAPRDPARDQLLQGQLLQRQQYIVAGKSLQLPRRIPSRGVAHLSPNLTAEPRRPGCGAGRSNKSPNGVRLRHLLPRISLALSRDTYRHLIARGNLKRKVFRRNTHSPRSQPPRGRPRNGVAGFIECTMCLLALPAHRKGGVSATWVAPRLV